MKYEYWRKNHLDSGDVEQYIRTAREALENGAAEEDVVWFGLGGLPEDDIRLIVAASKLLSKWFPKSG